MESFGAHFLNFISHQMWIVEIAIFFMSLLILNYVLKKVFVNIREKARYEDNDWKFYLQNAVLVPFRFLFWILFFAFTLNVLGEKLEWRSLSNFVGPIRNVAITLVVTWLLFRWKNIFYQSVSYRQREGKLAVTSVSLDVLSKLFTVSVLFVSILVVMRCLGWDIVPLITFGGIGAAAIGFASKDVVANFFGGLMIYVTRPFSVGDVIEIPDKKRIGTVEEIGWYFTSIRDLHKKPMYVPNSVFSTDFLVNQSRMTHRRIDEIISIRYKDAAKIQDITDKVRGFLNTIPEIDTHLPLNIYIKKFGLYAIELEVQIYVLATRYEQFMVIQQRILLEIYHIIHNLDAQIAIPLGGNGLTN